MLKAKVLSSKPDIVKVNKSEDFNISVFEIKKAVEDLDLKYKLLDELDIFNIYNYILLNKKGT